MKKLAPSRYCWYHHFENILSRSQKVKELTYDPEILLLGGILPKRNENIVLINVNRIINGQNWKQLKFPSTNEKISKMWYYPCNGI